MTVVGLAILIVKVLAALALVCAVIIGVFLAMLYSFIALLWAIQTMHDGWKWIQGHLTRG